jgi:hypothetical protein
MIFTILAWTRLLLRCGCCVRQQLKNSKARRAAGTDGTAKKQQPPPPPPQPQQQQQQRLGAPLLPLSMPATQMMSNEVGDVIESSGGMRKQSLFLTFT